MALFGLAWLLVLQVRMRGISTRLRSKLASTTMELDKSGFKLLVIATTILVVAMIGGVTVLTVLNRNTSTLLGLIPVLVVPFVGAVLFATNSKLDRVENKVDGVDVKVNGNLTNLLQMLDKFATSPTVVIPTPELEPKKEGGIDVGQS